MNKQVSIQYTTGLEVTKLFLSSLLTITNQNIYIITMVGNKVDSAKLDT